MYEYKVQGKYFGSIDHLEFLQDCARPLVCGIDRFDEIQQSLSRAQERQNTGRMKTAHWIRRLYPKDRNHHEGLTYRGAIHIGQYLT